MSTFCKICLLQGCQRPSLRNFVTKNEKIKIFFSNSPNGSICKVNWLKSKFEHLFQNLPNTGGSRTQFQNFLEEKWKNHFFLEIVQMTQFGKLTGWNRILSTFFEICLLNLKIQTFSELKLIDRVSVRYRWLVYKVAAFHYLTSTSGGSPGQFFLGFMNN